MKKGVAKLIFWSSVAAIGVPLVNHNLKNLQLRQDDLIRKNLNGEFDDKTLGRKMIVEDVVYLGDCAKDGIVATIGALLVLGIIDSISKKNKT